MIRPKLRLLYVSNARIPGPRAHALQTVSVCEALQNAGADVELLHPVRRGGTFSSDRTLGEFYGVRGEFRRTRLGSLDLIDLVPRFVRRPFFILQTLTFVANVRRHIASQDWDVLYVRDPHLL
ncbi:MAG: hypothetical protein ACREQQ_04475, partial [Candidatus Binatia bacterium]